MKRFYRIFSNEKVSTVWTQLTYSHLRLLFNIKFNRGEDLDLWSRLAKKFKIVKSSKITATYRVDAENRTNLSKNLEKCYYYHLPIDNINQEDKDNKENT